MPDFNFVYYNQKEFVDILLHNRGDFPDENQLREPDLNLNAGQATSLSLENSYGTPVEIALSISPITGRPSVESYAGKILIDIPFAVEQFSEQNSEANDVIAVDSARVYFTNLGGSEKPDVFILLKNEDQAIAGAITLIN